MKVLNLGKRRTATPAKLRKEKERRDRYMRRKDLSPILYISINWKILVRLYREIYSVY
jgi:hypothetical protein